jgi:hypothetical protein
MNVRSHLRHLFAAGMSAMLLAGSVAPAAPVVAESPQNAPTPNRVSWQGGNWYLNGANMPWFNWGCDFGCGAKGGVTDPAVNQQLDKGFAQLSGSGVKVVRWWVFEGDAWQITRDGSGLPSGINPQVYADMDAALELAKKHDLYFSFTLFHGQSNVPQHWLTDAAARKKLVEVLTPLFARYKGNPRLLAWDVMNEPEWDVWQGKIAKEPLQALVKEVATAVHTHSTANVTVGAAMLDGLPMWVGLGLDFYQAHWYDYMNGGQWCARCTDYATVQQRYGLDKPLIIGEFWAGTDTDAAQRLADFRAKGFAGAFAWSYFSDKTHDKLNIDLAAMKNFTGQHADTQIKGAPSVAQAEGELAG